MKKLLTYLLILLAALYVGLLIRRDPGYVLLAYHQWTIELPLWFAIVIVLISFWLVNRIVAGWHYFASFAARYNLWSGKRARYRSRTQTSRGLMELIEGYWQKAEKHLVNAAPNAEAPLINYLSAARAAQAQGAYDRRDHYLRLAHHSTAGSEIAVGLTQAELQLRHGQLEQALATLKHLEQSVPNHQSVLKMLVNLYEQLADWQSLLALLPRCKKLKVVSVAEKLNLQKQAFEALLNQAIKNGKSAEMTALWQEMPRDLIETHPVLLTRYATALIEFGESERAEATLREMLKSFWHGAWVLLYGKTRSANPAKQLALAEGWLKQHAEDPDLLLTLGRLCVREQLWGKAKTYLESSLQLKASADASQLLGQLLLDHFNDQKAALACYVKGLKAVGWVER